MGIVRLMKQRGVQLSFVLDEGLAILDGLISGLEGPAALWEPLFIHKPCYYFVSFFYLIWFFFLTSLIQDESMHSICLLFVSDVSQYWSKWKRFGHSEADCIYSSRSLINATQREHYWDFGGSRQEVRRSFLQKCFFFYVFCLRLPELRNAISQTRGKSNAKILWLWTWTQYIWAFGPQGKDSSFSLFHFTKSDNISLSIQLFPTSFSSAYRWSL